jgi:hypothetical protein
MNDLTDNHLTIELEGGGSQVLPLRKESITFFKNNGVESAYSARVKPNLWKLMSEEHRLQVHLNRIVSDLGGKSYLIEN